MSFLKVQVDLFVFADMDDPRTVLQASAATTKMLRTKYQHQVIETSYPAVGSLCFNLWSKDYSDFVEFMKTISEAHPLVELVCSVIDKKEVTLPLPTARAPLPDRFFWFDRDYLWCGKKPVRLVPNGTADIQKAYGDQMLRCYSPEQPGEVYSIPARLLQEQS